ncbi:TonB-dependent receptor, partial [Acidobacteria bacterium AH-259-G07]|nr:TonB-dependent receptor [Acidobacteria bacterium AH-259-G07]
YSLLTVPPGTYTVKVSMPGFKEYVETDVPVTVNRLARVDVTLEIGEVTETLTVTSETAILQTDTSEVRVEMTHEKLENLPVPLGRNYQELFKFLPGFSPPQRAHSIQTNPSRSRTFNVNGVSTSINTTRIDGITTTNPWLPHITGYVPSLEAIETVNAVTGTFDAEQGLAGGAAVTVQLKSGSNDFHGSAFFLHHGNALRAKRYIYPYPENLEKGKFIFNQWGGTIGGPIKQDKLFFFTSYEGTANSRFASRIGSVPTPAVKTGDLNNIGRDIYDPLTGNRDGTGRTQFPNNTIPQSRFDPAAVYILGKIPDPNITGRLNKESSNYFGTGRFTWDKYTTDTKIDFTANEKLNMFGRLSTLKYDVEQPTLFGNDNLLGRGLRSHGLGGGNPGFGTGTTWTWGYGANYIVSPNFIIDGNFGWAKFGTDSRNPFLDQNIGLDVLGIPGTNGTAFWAGGFPRFDLSGYNDYGTRETYMPYIRNDKNIQYTLNFNWTKGRHDFRWGLDLSYQQMNHTQPEGGVGQSSRGRFRFSRHLTKGCEEGPADAAVPGCQDFTRTTSRQSFAAFLLGMPNRMGKNHLTVFPYTTRNPLRGFYIRDRWQVTPKFTLSIGTRLENYPVPTRCCGRGFERYDPATNKMLVGGFGNVPRNMGVEVTDIYWAPRLGIAYRVTDTFVFRAGYGITIDPYPVARDLRTNHPLFIENDIQGEFNWLSPRTLREGIPAIVEPDISPGTIDIPLNVFAHTLGDKFDRGYIQSWNITLQKNLIGDMTGEVGYVATRAVRALGRRDLNWSPLGAGSGGRQLVQAFGRTAGTRLTDPAGHTNYDSLQTRLRRRFVGGISLDASYVWSKNIGTGFLDDDSDAGLKIDIPNLFHLNRALMEQDRTHNFQLMNIWELPFGNGKRWL